MHAGNELTCTYTHLLRSCADNFTGRENSELAEVLPSCVWSDVSTTLKSKLLKSEWGDLRQHKYTVPPEKKII